MSQKLKKHHFDFIHKLLVSHHIKGQAVLNPHVPPKLRAFVHDRVILTRNVAKTYCEERHIHKSAVRLCEAKIFIEMNPDVIEGLIVGNWQNLIHNIQEQEES